MKIVGILLLLLGGFLIVAGFGAAIFFFTNSGPKATCDLAASFKSSADEAESKWRSAMGRADENDLKTTYESLKRTAYVQEQVCNERKTQQRMFTIIGGVVGAVGFLLMFAGIGAFVVGRRRAATT